MLFITDKTEIRATARRVSTHLCRSSTTKSLMPGEYVELDVPDDYSEKSWALEPRYDCPVNNSVKDPSVWPHPQEITAVEGTIRVVNTRDEPIVIYKPACLSIMANVNY